MRPERIQLYEVPHPDPAWQARAACRPLAGASPAEVRANVDKFFPTELKFADVGKAVCEACPVRAECGEYATAWRLPYGTFGQVDERERRVARRLRKAV